MTAIQRTLIVACGAVAIGTAVIYEARQNHRLREENEMLHQRQTVLESTSNNPTTSALPDQMEQLSRQNTELTARLARAKATATQLAEAKQQAEHAASTYRQLADQAAAKNSASTNDYPTQRHVFAGFGKLAREITELDRQDESKLSADEKAASEEKRAGLLRDFMNLAILAGQFDQNKQAGGNSPETAAAADAGDSAADTMTCLLYGAMGLSEPQFEETYRILQTRQQQATEQNLFDNSSTPETQSALNRLNEDAGNQIQSLLTADQAQAFEGLLPSIQLVSRKLNITFTK